MFWVFCFLSPFQLMLWCPLTNPCVSESISTSCAQQILFLARAKHWFLSPNMPRTICQSHSMVLLSVPFLSVLHFLSTLELSFSWPSSLTSMELAAWRTAWSVHSGILNLRQTHKTRLFKTHLVPFELLMFLVTDDHRLGSILLVDPNLFRCCIGTLILCSAKTLWNCRHHQMLKCLQWVTYREGRCFGQLFLNCSAELVSLIPANKEGLSFFFSFKTYFILAF